MMDEDLLSAMDEDDEVRSRGRSAVFRRLAAEYLKLKKSREISSLYRKAYGGQKNILGAEFEGWEREGVWPED